MFCKLPVFGPAAIPAVVRQEWAFVKCFFFWTVGVNPCRRTPRTNDLWCHQGHQHLQHQHPQQSCNGCITGARRDHWHEEFNMGPEQQAASLNRTYGFKNTSNKLWKIAADQAEADSLQDGATIHWHLIHTLRKPDWNDKALGADSWQRFHSPELLCSQIASKWLNVPKH